MFSVGKVMRKERLVILDEYHRCIIDFYDYSSSS